MPRGYAAPGQSTQTQGLRPIERRLKTKTSTRSNDEDGREQIGKS